MNEDNVDTRPAFIPVNILNEHITYYIPPQRSEGRGGGGWGEEDGCRIKAG